MHRIHWLRSWADPVSSTALQFDSPVTLHPGPPKENERVNMINHFVQCCQTGETPDTSPEHGLLLSRIFDAIYKSSAENGRQVPVEL